MKRRILTAVLAAVLTLAATIPALALGARNVPPAYTTPEGYNGHDFLKLVTFLETEDGEGVKNGARMFEGYEPEDPETWLITVYDAETDEASYIPVAEWTVVSGEKRLENVTLRGSSGDLDLSDCTELTILDCGKCWGLTSLDVAGCTALEQLDMRGYYDGDVGLDSNLVTELDLSDCAQLRRLNICCCNWLEKITFPENALIEALDISYDSDLILCHSGIDISGFSYLKEFYCDHSYIYGLDLTLFPHLEKLSCSENPNINVLDIAACPELKMLNCAWTRVSALDLSENENFGFDRISTLGSGYVGYANCYYDYDTCELIPGREQAIAGGYDFIGWYTEDGEFISDWWALLLEDAGTTRIVAHFPGSVTPGDADGDGQITATDALLALRAAMGLIEGSDACDFNGDGAVDSQDALLILRYSMGLI
ncbi:MAG: hypothetical protein IIZ66_06550 [Clostridia bacterium]|nr:hypothetical protein [Clostridia bacterium]